MIQKLIKRSKSTTKEIKGNCNCAIRSLPHFWYIADITQPAITGSKVTVKTIQKGVKYVQS